MFTIRTGTGRLLLSSADEAAARRMAQTISDQRRAAISVHGGGRCVFIAYPR